MTQQTETPALEIVRAQLNAACVTYDELYATDSGYQIEVYGTGKKTVAKLEAAGFVNVSRQQDYMDDEPYALIRFNLPELLAEEPPASDAPLKFADLPLAEQLMIAAYRKGILPTLVEYVARKNGVELEVAAPDETPQPIISPFHITIRTTGKTMRDGQEVGSDSYRLRRAFAQAGGLILNGFVVVDFDDANWSEHFENLIFTLADTLKRSE